MGQAFLIALILVLYISEVLVIKDDVALILLTHFGIPRVTLSSVNAREIIVNAVDTPYRTDKAIRNHSTSLVWRRF